jgi:hypothetical protein
MSGSQWATACLSWAVGSLLLIAGTAKIVSTGQLVRALAAVRLGRAGSVGVVRSVAFVEVGVALLLCVPQTRTVAAVIAVVLGVCFAGAGVAGRLSGGSTACGCFGSHSSRPLGPVNVAFGLFVSAASLLIAMTPDVAGQTHYFRVGVIGLSTLTLALCLWIHRRLIRDLTRPLPSSR